MSLRGQVPLFTTERERVMKNNRLILALCATVGSSAAAQTFTLSDLNSTAEFDTASGQISWMVDGVEQIFDQSFWFRRAADSQEYRVNDVNLSLDGVFTADTNPFRDTNDDAFGQLYSDGNGLQIETIFTLRGGNAGSGRADLGEQIILRNNGTSAISLSFFQFVDFDLGGDFSDDSAQIINGNTVQQSDDDFFVSEVVVSPAPTLVQVSNQFDIFSALSDGDIDDLNGNTSFGPGDAGWAFQWDITIAAGDSFIISKDKSIVPAPGSVALLSIAGLAATRRRR